MWLQGVGSSASLLELNVAAYFLQSRQGWILPGRDHLHTEC